MCIKVYMLVSCVCEGVCVNEMYVIGSDGLCPSIGKLDHSILIQVSLELRVNGAPGRCITTDLSRMLFMLSFAYIRLFKVFGVLNNLL